MIREYKTAEAFSSLSCVFRSRFSGLCPASSVFCLLSSALCLVLLTACCRTSDIKDRPDTVKLSIKGISCCAEIARTPEQRSRGLMHRKELSPEAGMLFIYPDDRIPAFWMKNTLIPLSIAFIDPAGMIIDIQDMEPETEDRHSPPSRIRYALEVNRGWFAGKGISAGDSVLGLPFR